MTDYSEIEPPADKDPAEYHYTERRAEILQLIERKGHPWGFNYTQLGERYGVSRQQIAKDFDRLRDWYRERVGTDALTASDIAYRRIVQEHMDNQDFEKARRALDSWNSWLQETGHQESEPEQLEVSGEGGTPLEVTINRESYDGDDEQ